MKDDAEKSTLLASLAKSLLIGSLGPAALGLTGCATFPGSGGPNLEEEIEAIISTPPLGQLHWGILIVDPERGQILYSRSAHRKFVPASNMKVLSTSTALSLLGPDYRFETEIWRVGELNRSSGRLDGDLVLRPTGDPTLSERFYPSATAPLDSLAQGLWEAGVRSVTGSLVVDASAWDSTTVPGSWMVGNLPSRSAATGAALAAQVARATAEAFMKDHELSPRVDPELCRGCERCADICPFDAIKMVADAQGVFTAEVLRHNCVGCGGCVGRCPVTALNMPYFSNQMIEEIMVGTLAGER